MRHLSNEAAVKSVMVAARRTAHLQVEAELAAICREMLQEVQSRLSRAAARPGSGTRSGVQDAEQGLLEALQVLRLSEHLSGDQKALLSFWAAPEAAEPAPQQHDMEEPEQPRAASAGM